MKININGKNTRITPTLTETVNKKLRSIGKFFPDDAVANVFIATEKNHRRIEVTVTSRDTIIRSERTTNDLYCAIDEVVAKLERQIAKNRTKLEKRLKTGLPSEYFMDIETDTEFEPQVVKTKRFAVKPMSQDEAILQMELLGHNFFVFTNADTNQVNVLYQRSDGNYGLIEPEYS